MVAPEGALLTAPTPDAFAAGVARLLDDPALRETMGAAAARFVTADRTLERFQHRLAAGLAVLGLPCAPSTSP
jgi:glycosyltransferase involved in cell wall biosynthesis